MDQTQLSGLDPKLKEAYDRVMGTATAASSATPSPDPVPATPTVNPAVVAPPTEQQTSEPVVATEEASHPLIAEVSEPTLSPAVEPTPAPPVVQPAPTANAMFSGGIPQTIGNDTQMQAYLADEVAGAKQSLKLIQLLYIGGAILFFVVYALFWMRFFQVTPSF